MFSLLGTTYGGDGVQTFALPDLRGRVAIHEGQGPGLSGYELGQASGSEEVTLLISEMPHHNHMITVAATTTSADPTGNIPSALTDDLGSNTKGYGAPTPMSLMAPTALSVAGGGQPHNNMQPYLAVNWCIALEGIYPSRN